MENLKKIRYFIIEIENNKNRISRSLGITRDPQDNKVRGISLEFRHSLFATDDTINNETYTFDDYVNELSKYFGKQIDVKNFLKGKIKDENEDSFYGRLKEYLKKDNYLFPEEENYDIIFASNLMNYKTGDKISPDFLLYINFVYKACSFRKRFWKNDLKVLLFIQITS